MIRTHRPRGFAWTCPSAFQQTELFRQINYEDCLVEDDDANEIEFPSDRAAKRRRIETLADNFLNGQPLHISSARLGPQSLTSAVCRSFRKPKDGRAILGETQNPVRSEGVLWEDVQDDWEVLRDFNQQRKRIDGDVVELDDSLVLVNGDSEGYVRATAVVHAQASCTSARKPRVARLAIGPSEEALRQAAELRNRIARRRSARLSVPLLVNQASSADSIGETQDETTETSISESISEIGPTPTAAWTSSKWLKSGLLEVRRKGVDEECSKDELGLSSVATPSQRKEAKTMANLRRARSAASQAKTDATSTANQSTSQSLPISTREDSYSGAITGTDPSAGAVFETAPEEATMNQASMGPMETQDLTGDSQDQLLRRQGIHVAPRRSWAPINTGSSIGQDLQIPSHEASLNVPAAPLDTRSSRLDSSQQNTSKPKAKRATKSTGTAMNPPVRRSTRRQSAPSDSQAYGNDRSQTGPVPAAAIPSERLDYTAAPSKDSSPFLFRKRGSRANTSEITDADANKKSRSRNGKTRVEQSEDTPSNDNNVTNTDCTHAKTVPAKTPRRRVDFSSAAEAPVKDPTSTTPLTDQHLNRVLPRDPERRTSIRRSLRQELLISGAEMSHYNDDLTLATSNGTLSEHSQPQFWPGTQVLLAKAQTDLFTSPEKPHPATAPAVHATTPNIGAEQTSRGPLKTLSQERAYAPLPNTQALIDEWQGWSSVKKPRQKSDDLKRKSLALSPTVLEKIGSSDEGRRSSLRFEMDLSLNDVEDEEEESDTLRQIEEGASAQEQTAIPPSLSTAGETHSSLPAARSSSDNPSTTSSSADIPPNRRPRPFAAHRPLVPLSSSHNFQVPSSLSLHAGLSSLKVPATFDPVSSVKCADSTGINESTAIGGEEDGADQSEYLRLSFQQAQVWDQDSLGFDSTTELVTGTLPQQIPEQESQVSCASSAEVARRKRMLDGTSQLSEDLNGLVHEVLEKSMEGYVGNGGP